jgi:hypothetical protein
VGAKSFDGGCGASDLWSGEEKLPTAEADTGLACDVPWNRGRSQSRFTGNGPLWEIEHGFYRARESDCPPWNSCASSSHLGGGSAVPTVVSSPGVVARLLPFCAPTSITVSGARAAAGAMANCWHNSTGIVLQLWRRGEPTEDGRRGKCCAIPYRWGHASSGEHEGCEATPCERAGKVW